MRVFLLAAGITLIATSALVSIKAVGDRFVTHSAYRGRPTRRRRTVTRTSWHLRKSDSSEVAVCAVLYSAGFVGLHFGYRKRTLSFLKPVGTACISFGFFASLLTGLGLTRDTPLVFPFYIAVHFAAGFAALYFRNRLITGE